MLVVARSAFVVVAILAIAVIKRITTLILIVKGTKEGAKL
jgi:hypothetical protein